MIGTGMPATILLEQFAGLLRDAFPGSGIYLVGSAATSKEWRDVDVRCMLTTSQWRRYVGERGIDMRDPLREEKNSSAWPVGKRRTALTLAFAELGRRMTGLPIDFQFQTNDHANEYYGNKLRVPLGLNVRLAR